MKHRFSFFGFGLVVALAVGAARAEERPLRIDPARSQVEIEVKATVDSFVGRLDAYEATVMVDDVTGRVTSARVGFHFADVHTGKAARDEQMHAWQDTARHPDGFFTLAELVSTTNGWLEARGTLSLHDVAREIRFPVAITRDGERFGIDGDAALDVRDFGLPVIRKFLVLSVEPVVHVRFHLQGALAPAVRSGLAAK